MAKLTPIAGAIVVLGFLLPNSGRAATDDVAALRAELEALKTDYSSRVQALEARIKQLESAVVTAQLGAAPAPPAPAPAYPQPSPVAPSGKSSNATAFNPAISMILTGNYASLSQDPATYRVAGFIPPPAGEGPGNRSFNLDESELTVASNVDPYFFGNVTAAIQGDNRIDIEEAYFKTLALNNGFTIKGGRFFSATGYLNEIHSHNWDFVDQPLVYQVFLGGQLAQDGAVIRKLRRRARAVGCVRLAVESGHGLGDGADRPADPFWRPGGAATDRALNLLPFAGQRPFRYYVKQSANGFATFARRFTHAVRIVRAGTLRA
jgi:hypothetical protein